MNKTVSWQQCTISDWHAEHRGLAIRIRVDGTGRPTTINYYVAGKLDQSAPVSCTIDDAKRIGLEVIDRLMPVTPHWQAAANKQDRDSLLRR